MTETRKLAAILVADIVGYSKLAGADEDRILARLRTLRSDLIDPTIAVHSGRIVKRTGDGSIVEFRSVVDAVRCAIEVQSGLAERNAGLPPERRIEFRVGIHLGDVVEEADGDLMGDGVNIAARLEGVGKPGAICLSEDAYRQVKRRLGLKVSDLGAKQLKNIVEPIRVYLLEVDQAARTEPTSSERPSEKFAPPYLSIVVLPFVNLGGDPEHNYFVDGVTENLTTDLSRIRGSFVIGRQTAFAYRGKSVDLKQIGRELNVRYILEGSVQRGGDRIRVNVQLIDAESGRHIWAERFDKQFANLFDMQDEIVSRLANVLGAQLIAAEARRAQTTPNPDSMELWFQGAAWANTGVTAEALANASHFFERALERDPTNVDALVGMAIAIVDAIAAFVSIGERRVRLASAETALTKALSMAPEHALAHYGMGFVLGYTNRAEEGIAECERALALDRNLAAAHATVGYIKSFAGRSEETEAHIQQAIRLSPQDPWVFAWLAGAGFAKNFLDRHEEAVDWLRRSIESNRNYPMSHFHLAAALAHLGRVKEARAAAGSGLALNPTFTIADYRADAFSDNATYLAQRERFIEGLRKAGISEG
jgi:TolB-like protein/class 3 adenylate cyclase/Tfp pilus assembly protein PilF